MDASILVAAVAFGGVLAATLAIIQVADRRPTAVVRRRLGDHAVRVAVDQGQRRERVNVLREPTYSASPLLNTLLRRVRPARTAARELILADAGLSVMQYLLLRLLLAAGLLVGFQLAAVGIVYGAPTAVVGLMLPRLLLKRRARRRRIAFEAQLAEAIDLLVGALRSGYGFLQGIESAAREMGDPMRKELLRVVEQVNVGVNPVDALEDLTRRLESYDLGLFSAAISVQRQAGGNLAEVLENLAATVRERRRVRGEVLALTTGPRVSSYVLAAIPVLLLLYFVAISSEYRLVMLGTLFGKMLLGAAGVWSLIGFLLSQKVAKVEY